MIKGQILIAILQKLYKAVFQMRRNFKKVIDTKHSLGKANLSSSIITPEGQSILV